MKKSNVMNYVLLLVLAFCLFATQVYRPIDETSRNIWREADIGSITRNYYQEGMNILYPRIDWRGAGPGFVESEFPFQAWLGAVLYLIFGYHEWLLRLISMVTMLGCCGVFFLLARLILTEKAAFLASLIFVLHPYIFLMSTAIQPEPIMLLGYLLAIYGFIKWIQTDERFYYCIALLATTFAILAKVPAAHVGILFALLSLDKYGIKALFSLRLWFFALFTLGIPFIWYLHARSLWEVYGNSLGISNEAFARIGILQVHDFFKTRILGNLFIEIKKIWMGFGCILGLAGFISFAAKKEGKIILYWGISLVMFYIISGATTGEDWASYYHIVSVPFACIVMAKGAFYIKDQFFLSWWGRFVAPVLIVSVMIIEIGVFVYTDFIRKPPVSDHFYSAKEFKPLISKDALIVANGAPTTDSVGRPIAGNASYYFFWLDRKGFTLHLDSQSMDNLMDYKNQGAKYFVIEKIFIETNPSFYNEVFTAFPVIDKTDWAVLVELTPKER